MPDDQDLPHTGSVFVLSLDLSSVGTDARAVPLNLLDDAEKRRAERFRFVEDRLAYVAAHALLRLALSAAAGGDPGAWRFEAGLRGKPRLAAVHGLADLRFNLSHTRGMVTVALARGAEVGVDVERRARRGRLDLELAESRFAPEEAESLRALSDDASRRERFLRLWTLKEAFVKATGRGLSQPLSEFVVTLDPVSIHAPVGLGRGLWYGAEWSLNAYRLAVVADWHRAEAPSFVHRPVLAPLSLSNVRQLLDGTGCGQSER